MASAEADSARMGATGSRRDGEERSPVVQRVPREHHPRWSTGYVAVDPRLCEACGDCVEVCRNGVLGVVGFLFHKHVKVIRPEECRGCGKCAAVCPNGAIVLGRISRGTDTTST